MIGALLSRINYLEKVTIGDLKARVKELEAELEDAKPKMIKELRK
jgi:vacuolar-type H+-ATPase subunit D/Vma8